MTIILTESQKSKLSTLAEHINTNNDNYETFTAILDGLVEEGVDVSTALLENYGIDVDNDDDE